MDSRSETRALGITVLVALLLAVGIVISYSYKRTEQRLDALEKAAVPTATAKLARCPPELEGFPFSHSIMQSPARTGIDSAMLTCFYRKIPKAPAT